MKKLFGLGVVALAAALVAGNAGNASAQSGQVKCEQNAAKSVAKFAGAKVGCRNKCWAGMRKGDATRECDPAGGVDATTQACITAVENKAVAASVKKCAAPNCPACYSGGDCNADAADKVNTAENLVDTQDNGGPGTVHCSGGTQDKAHGACQDNTGKVLTKLVAALGKCTAKCVSNEAKGSAAPGSCAPPASDPGAQACISAAMGKCGPAVDKKCGASAPTCWSAPFNNGAGWCGLVKGIVDAQYNDYYCAPNSPSGAFLD